MYSNFTSFIINYRGEKPQKVARHIALVHNRLDELLADKQLVEARKQELALKPNKVVIGEKCPVCDQQLNKQHSRVHVIWHFMDDLRDIVSAFPSNTVCLLFINLMIICNNFIRLLLVFDSILLISKL